MFSYLQSFFNFFSSKTDDDGEDADYDKENFLAEQLVNLEIETIRNNNDEIHPFVENPQEVECFQRTGVITYMDDGYILIDGMIYFELSSCSISLHLNDKILYLGYKDSNNQIIVTRILENYGTSWGEEDEKTEEHKFKILEHVIIGEVERREERQVFIKDSDLKFSLDVVNGTFIPVKGDWLEMKCSVQWDEEKPIEISSEQVLQVISFKALRRKIKTSIVTEWTGDYGVCDRHIYFDSQSFQAGAEPQLGSKVIIEAIESNQGVCPWRVIKLLVDEHSTSIPHKVEQSDEINLNAEKGRGIEVTYPLKFDKVDFRNFSRLNLNITNNSDQVHTINKWIVLSKIKNSQVDIKPCINQPRTLYPQQSFSLTITCYPKFLGNAKECLIIMFRGFQVKRFIEINVVDNSFPSNNAHTGSNRSINDNINNMRQIRKTDSSFVPGVKLVKPPAFVPVKLGGFAIPEKAWSAVLGDSEQTIDGPDFNKIVLRIESTYPCLIQDLNIGNYIDKWHTLLYMEEIQANISMRAYDMKKTFLSHTQEYLGLEIKGLSERRPSLIKGDRAIVKDVWDATCPSYEGYIHAIKGDMVLMKFHQQFHESYNGSDVSIEFHFSRSGFRKSHQAINLALSNLGPDILFPSRIKTHYLQVPKEQLNGLKWFNEKLNEGQKAAVTNILLGECRPMPYIIYGPPGTGKTITVIETILQILNHLPDSRILVATPSNSAGNLVTERLLQYRDVFSDSIVRLIGHHLVGSENIPDIIKPFCATLDIGMEETSKSRYFVKNGINHNCQTSFIGRHRVTIGTCISIGTLAQMGLPRGHFTHIIVDEAGQATEPEIMVPMTFTDKENGQIILAGDPMQLGPVVLSKYCQEFGMDESYMSRILETFPYQRDYSAFAGGYNQKLVTKLSDNYRSVEEVLTLPSEMFYNGILVANINKTLPWISKIVNTFSELFDTDVGSGGIYVFGIKGCNARAEDSPSWYNPQEASMLALTTCKLYKKNITADEIGIITPYVAQIKFLKVLFHAMGLPQPKIGTVEEFQGQERAVILLSTVRSTEAQLNEDQKHTLGFVKNPKRLNVALTRAQVAVLLFCDPHLLSKDPLWSKVINQAVKEEKYMGCDAPNIFDSTTEEAL